MFYYLRLLVLHHMEHLFEPCFESTNQNQEFIYAVEVTGKVNHKGTCRYLVDLKLTFDLLML